ncbi:hypothetical protein O988_09574 [Pseudogymnoascus sp. VKM F-3808]|nr:hypothetical protein O988_09574 [Pseudogymnoascus sp. VKM F-3808]
MYKTIREEAIIATVLFAVYMMIVLIGAGRFIAGLISRDKTRAEGGGAPVFYEESSSRDARPGEFGAFGGEVETPFPRDREEPWMAGGVGEGGGEKVGHVAQRSVGEASVGGHGRASSYGFVGEKGI